VVPDDKDSEVREALEQEQQSMSGPLVSVIVPTRNSGKTIGACLESIAAQSYPQVEIIVVDNSSEDDTCLISRRYTDNVFLHGPERSAQRNYGASISKGEYLLLPDSDMRLSADVVEHCVAKALADPAVKAIVIPEESFGVGFWADCRKLERSYYKGVDWLEAARFFERGVFEEMGGYDLRNTGTEDFDLPQRIKALYGQASNSRVDAVIYHNEQDMSLLEACRTNYYQQGELPQAIQHIPEVRTLLLGPREAFQRPSPGPRDALHEGLRPRCLGGRLPRRKGGGIISAGKTCLSSPGSSGASGSRACRLCCQRSSWSHARCARAV
jgi:hypothetical protein